MSTATTLDYTTNLLLSKRNARQHTFSYRRNCLGRGDDTPLNRGVVQSGNGLRTPTTQESVFRRVECQHISAKRPHKCEKPGRMSQASSRAVTCLINRWMCALQRRYAIPLRTGVAGPRAKHAFHGM